MSAHPHTIESGNGEKLTFPGRVEDVSGDHLGVENFVKPGSGPPTHVHHSQEEAIAVQRGGQPRSAGRGETVVFEPDAPEPVRR